MKLSEFNSTLPHVVNITTLMNDLKSTKQTVGQLFQTISKIKTPARAMMRAVDSKVLGKTDTTQRTLLALFHSRTTKAHIIDNVDTLVTLLSGMPKQVTGRDATRRTSSIIACAELYNVFVSCTSSYMIELLKASGSKKDMYTPHRPTLRKLNKDAATYALAINYLQLKPKELLTQLNAIPELRLNEKNEDAVKQSGAFGLGDSPIDFMTTAFIYNPIYHVRLYITEYQVWRYKIHRDEAQQLELLLMALEAEKQGNSSVGIEREIEITEERIAIARRKMSQIYEERDNG